MNAAHLIYIPSILFVGIIVGWVLGSRAAQDAFAAQTRRNEERRRKKGRNGTKNEE